MLRNQASSNKGSQSDLGVNQNDPTPSECNESYASRDSRQISAAIHVDQDSSRLDSLGTKRSPKAGTGQDDVVSLLDEDILLGRGNGYTNHPGNLRLQELVDLNQAEYDSTNNRDRKTEITNEIVGELISEGRRFLKVRERGKPKYGKEGHSWTVVSHDTARFKVSHKLRDGRVYRKEAPHPLSRSARADRVEPDTKPSAKPNTKPNTKPATKANKPVSLGETNRPSEMNLPVRVDESSLSRTAVGAMNPSPPQVAAGVSGLQQFSLGPRPLPVRPRDPSQVPTSLTLPGGSSLLLPLSVSLATGTSLPLGTTSFTRGHRPADLLSTLSALQASQNRALALQSIQAALVPNMSLQLPALQHVLPSLTNPLYGGVAVPAYPLLQPLRTMPLNPSQIREQELLRTMLLLAATRNVANQNLR